MFHPLSRVLPRQFVFLRCSQARFPTPAFKPQGLESAVRCGRPIKTSINNINCRPTPVPKAPSTATLLPRLQPRSKGVGCVAFNQYPRNAAADGWWRCRSVGKTVLMEVERRSAVCDVVWLVGVVGVVVGLVPMLLP